MCLRVEPLQPGLLELCYIALVKGATRDQEQFADKCGIPRRDDVAQPGAPRETNQHHGWRRVGRQSHAQLLDLPFQGRCRLERLQYAPVVCQFSCDGSHFTSGTWAAMDNRHSVWCWSVGPMVFHALTCLSQVASELPNY